MIKWFIYRCVPESQIQGILTFVTLTLVVAFLKVVGRLLRSYKVGSFGPLCFVMLTVSILLVSLVNL